MKKYFLILCVGVFATIGSAFGQNLSTEGSDFWFGFMDNWLQSTNNPIILEVYLSADDTTKGIIEMPLVSEFTTIEFIVLPGITTKIVIPPELAEAVGSKNIESKGIHISTETEVSVYAMNKRQYSADVTVILPTFSLSNNYLVMSHWENGNRNNNENSNSEFLIVATEDDTNIEITPSVNISGSGGGSANVPFVIGLNKGETYQIQARGDLTGTKIVGLNNNEGKCFNFAVFGGNQYTKVGQCNHPDGHDHLFAQMYPVKTWGTLYTVVDFESRNGGDLVKVLAAEDSTIINIGGEQLALSAGEFVARTLEGVNVITANKPVAVGQFSRSQGCDGTKGDPFMIMISPNQQLLRSITFNAPSIATVSNYSLNVITPTQDVPNVRFDGQSISDKFLPVPDTPDMSYARVVTSSGNHTIFSEVGFIAYVYGYGFNESFGYSTGAGLANLSLGIDIKNQLGISVPADSLCLFDQSVFTPVSEFDFDTYFFDFGDGTTVTRFNKDSVVHQYSKPGTYLFRLIGLDDQNDCTGGNEETEIKLIKVINPGLTIRGPRSICPNTRGVEYYVENNIHYENQWFVEGGTVVSSANNGIIVDWGTSNDHASIKLLSQNRYNCIGDTVVLPVRINIELDPEAPFGADSLCITMTQSVPYYTYPTQGSTYSWNIENGEIITGQGTNSVLVNWFSPGFGNLWFEQMAQTDTICDGISDTLTVYIQREPDVDASISSNKEFYQLDEPVILNFTADSLFQFVRLYLNGEVYADSLALQNPYELMFDCAGLYEFGIEVYDTVGLCLNVANAKHSVTVIPPDIDIIRVSHDLLEDSTLSITWQIDNIDIKSGRFVLEREQTGWLILDTLETQGGEYFDWPLFTSDQTYTYRISDLDVCANSLAPRQHTSMVLSVEQSSESADAMLEWTPYLGWEFGVFEYEIYRNVDGNGWRRIHTTSVNTFTYQNDTVGFDQCFRIRAIENMGHLSQSYSNSDCAFYEPELYAYNIITPNGDSKNEFFIIENVELYPASRLVITNRWGEIVLDEAGYQNNWQGSQRGNNLSSGVYYYVLQLNEPRVKLEKINGTISILR